MVDARPASLAATNASLTQPDLPKSTGTRDEVADLGFGEDVLLQRNEVLVDEFAGSLESLAVGREAA